MKSLLLALAIGLAGATTADAWTPPEAAPIAALDAALIATMKAGTAQASFSSRYAALAPVVVKSLNLPTILQNSVGFLWSSIPQAQQTQLAAVFEQFTVASYVNGFGGYNGERIEVLPTERPLGGKQIVESQIVPGDGSDPTRLDYVMTNGPGGWQATDVLLNGTISKVAVQLSDYSALVTPGDASQLIAALQNKISVLSNGSLGK